MQGWGPSPYNNEISPVTYPTLYVTDVIEHSRIVNNAEEVLILKRVIFRWRREFLVTKALVEYCSSLDLRHHNAHSPDVAFTVHSNIRMRSRISFLGWYCGQG